MQLDVLVKVELELYNELLAFSVTERSWAVIGVVGGVKVELELHNRLLACSAGEGGRVIIPLVGGIEVELELQ